MLEAFKVDKLKEKKRKTINQNVDSCTLCLEHIDDFTEHQLKMILTASYYMNEKNMICGLDNMIIKTKVDLAKLFGVSVENDTLKELIHREAIRKVKIGAFWVYAVNPYITHKGRTVSPELYMAFHKSKYRYVYTDDCYEEVLI